MKKKKKPLSKTWTEKYRGGYLGPLDSQILHFLWKWKVATASVLYEALAADFSPFTVNKRLRKLERNELIRANYDM